MIAWLAHIAGLIGALIIHAASEEGRRWVARGIALGIMLAGFAALIKVLFEIGEDLANAAFTTAMSLMGSDPYSGAALEWIWCVTPQSAPDAVGVVFAVLGLAGGIAIARWTISLRMGA